MTEPTARAGAIAIVLLAVAPVGAQPRAVANLKDIAPEEQVASVGYCHGKYDVALRNGSTRTLKEYDLAFKIDSGPNGPRPGTPALVPTGGVGDRAFAIFADLDKLRGSLKVSCRD